ncbi:MAG TPA: hypothetical protein VMM38_07910 [Aridibacter sp.]|nr:hypothetical protein [Aridibacter sp.]
MPFELMCLSDLAGNRKMDKIEIERIVSSFQKLAVEWGKSLEEGDSTRTNRLHCKLMAIEKQLIESDSLSRLEGFFQDPSESVRLSTCSALKETNRKTAIKVLRKLAESNSIIGVCAKTQLRIMGEKVKFI